MSMLGEFEFIDAIVAGLGDHAAGGGLRSAQRTIRPSSRPRPAAQVASIDTLLPDAFSCRSHHSSLVTVRLWCLFRIWRPWARCRVTAWSHFPWTNRKLHWGAHGRSSCSRDGGSGKRTRCLCLWGNLSRGPLNIVVSVHGEIEPGRPLLRSTGGPVWVFT